MTSAARTATVGGDGHRALVRGLVAGIDPLDAQEADDRAAALAWVDGGAPLCRTAKPATPPTHLVAYAVAVDPDAGSVLLVDHRLSGLWLPTGGHVDPGEHPTATAARELTEELAVAPVPLAGVAAPMFLSVTTTVGRTAGHVDVSLWYAFALASDARLVPDPREFAGARWWPPVDVAHGPGTRFGPEVPRFLRKLARHPGGA